MPSTVRLERIADRIKQMLATLVMQKVNDPRLEGVFINDVKVDRELAYADVYVSAVEGVERAKDIVDALEHASGFLRHELAGQIDLRSFPRLRFHWDPTPEHADHIEKILASIRPELDKAEDEKGDTGR
ncbi:MAG: 30S ribosome-binding factor RbfA [Anaerolinea sp.]|nr:30S ribosome-binding factor RbfA [Anaerolinea sp.]